MGPALIAAFIGDAISAGGQAVGGVMQNKDAREASELQSDLDTKMQDFTDQQKELDMRRQQQMFAQQKEQTNKALLQRRQDTKDASMQADTQAIGGMLNYGDRQRFDKINKDRMNLLRRGGQLG